MRRSRRIPRAVVRPGRSGVRLAIVKSGLDFKGAVKELDSRQQVRLGVASKDINKRVGVTNAHELKIVGAWSDGAENSIMWRSDAGWAETVLAAAMKGHLADQKAVLVFQQQERGVGVLAQFEASGKLEKIHKNLLKDGVENHTIVPRADGKGATVYVVDIDGSNLNKVVAAAERYGEDVYYQTGRAEFIGNTDYTDEDGKPLSDRQQRDRAREVYESIIEQSSIKEAEAIWEDVRDYWGAPTEEEGYDLTPSALIAENPNIKKGTVRKVVREDQRRAGADAQRRHGVRQRHAGAEDRQRLPAKPQRQLRADHHGHVVHAVVGAHHQHRRAEDRSHRATGTSSSKGLFGSASVLTVCAGGAC